LRGHHGVNDIFVLYVVINDGIKLLPIITYYDMSSSKSPRGNSCGISCLISEFNREIDENFALLGYYAARSGICLPTFRELGSPETSARNYHHTPRDSPEERSSVDNCCSGNNTTER